MTVVAMSSLFSFQSPATACRTSVGVQAFLVGSLVGRMAGTLLQGGVSESLALITDERQVPMSYRCRPPRLDGTFFLSSCSENTLVGREGDCVLINSFHLHVFQNLVKACAQFAGLMLVFLHQHWMDFVMGTKISSNYIDFCLHSAQLTMSRMHSPVLIV
jgi:hypothetical protein